MIEAKPTHLTVSEYCARMETKDITVNKDYQRSDRVWPDTARSFLIESILLGFPLPKFYHHSITNVKTKKTTSQIIDGQQRSAAIFDYYGDKFALSAKLETDELKGRRYSELDEAWQGKFLSYLLGIDMFLGVSNVDVRQIFRRMNSYTVPLNPEELRHATFQGEFKWFIAAKAEEHQEFFTGYSILTEKAVVRMLDLKLLSEVVHALDNGIRTTNKTHLDSLYLKYDNEFPHETDYGDMLDFAFGNMAELDALDTSNLSKPYIVYSLGIALAHQVRLVPDLEAEGQEQQTAEVDMKRLNQNLVVLSESLELDEDEIEKSPFKTFIEACLDRTNVRSQRETRARWFLRAIHEDFVAL
jgi:Protein of unknown function DUF262